jgi:hypothetical protein
MNNGHEIMMTDVAATFTISKNIDCVCANVPTTA